LSAERRREIGPLRRHGDLQGAFARAVVAQAVME